MSTARRLWIFGLCQPVIIMYVQSFSRFGRLIQPLNSMFYCVFFSSNMNRSGQQNRYLVHLFKQKEISILNRGVTTPWRNKHIFTINGSLYKSKNKEMIVCFRNLFQATTVKQTVCSNGYIYTNNHHQVEFKPLKIFQILDLLLKYLEYLQNF